MFKSTLAAMAAVFALSALSALSPAAMAAKGDPHVLLTTSAGNIELELDKQKAPVSVQNFVDYVNSGFYNNTTFHRVIPGFMIQGGGFEPGMKQKATKEPIKNEANNGLKNTRGTLAMARTQAPHSATAQFFINVVDNDFLNFSGESLQGWGYCVFAEVVDGMDVVDKIKGVATGRNGMHQDVPKEDVIIESVTVSE
ncbi:peptidylprolyl isomerase B [Shigella flexneri]|nr:peptidylprolyl isomerase B [Shigella flexneri]